MTYGSVPQMNPDLPETAVNAVFQSSRDIALILDKTIKAGYGVLEPGTVLSVAADNELVPYVDDDLTDAKNANAVAYALADVAASGTTIKVLKEDSYRFSVGDVLVISEDGGPTYMDGGAITAIDRTTAPNFASITFTTGLSAAATVANGARCYIKTGTTGKLSAAAYVLDKAVDTGYGEGAVGATSSVVVSNAILVAGFMIGLDSAAVTSLGGVLDGNNFILK